MYSINKINIFFLIFFILFKLLFINIIDQNRLMPIEPDDAYYYITKSNLIYNDPRGTNLNQSIQKKIIEDTSKKPKLTNNEIYLIDVLDRLTKPSYYLYTKIFGFFYIKKNFDPNKIWWTINYITQILISLSIFLILINFINPKNNLYFILYFVLSFFIMIPAKHQIMSTPMVIGNSLMLIGWYILTKYQKSIILLFIGFSIFFIALHFHPALFIICFLIFLYHLINLTFNKNFKNFIDVLIFFSIPIIAILLEYISVKFFLVDTYTGLFNMNFKGSDISNLNLYEIFKFNIKETLYRFGDIIKPLTFINSYKINILIYFVTIYITYKFNKNLFYFSIITLFCIFMGNFHYFPNHKGELIEYTMNFLSVFIFANIILSYLVFFEYLKKRLSYFNIKFALGVLILLVTANNTPLLLKIIENRTNKDNYLYSSDKLKTFVEVNTINKNEAIITDNFITFSLLNSIYFDKIILLADNVHRIHEWRLNEDIYINSYVGIKQPTNLKFSGKNISIEKKKILEGVKPIKFFSYKKTIN